MADNFLWRELKQTFNSGSMVMRLIVVNVIVFLVLHLVSIIFFLSQSPYSVEDNFMKDYLAVPANLTLLLHRPWTLITYSFTHYEFLHILFNMLWLYWLGSVFTEFLGNKRLLPVYLMGAFAGAALYILAYNIFPVFRTSVPDSTAIGASAGVLAIVVAAATLLPDYSIMLFIWPIRLKWLAVISVASDFIEIDKSNSGGHIAHIGGALFGFVFVKQLQSGNDWSAWMNKFFDWLVGLFSGRPKLKVSYSKPSYGGETKLKKQERDQDRLDAILDKISQSGYESLNKEDKEFLFKASHDSK